MTVPQAIDRIVELAEPATERRYREYLERLHEHELQRLLNDLEADLDKPIDRRGYVRPGRNF